MGGRRALPKATGTPVLHLEVGSRVEVFWGGDRCYYNGEVTEISIDSVRIRYDDGDTRNTVLDHNSYCIPEDKVTKNGVSWKLSHKQKEVEGKHPTANTPARMSHGTRVTVFWSGKGGTKVGTLVAFADSFCKVQYDDGKTINNILYYKRFKSKMSPAKSNGEGPAWALNYDYLWDELAEGGEGVVQNLLAVSASLDRLDDRHMTPLQRAAEKSQLAIVEELIWGGASIDLRHAPSGKTALFFAFENNNEDVVAVLIAAGANIMAVNNEGVSFKTLLNQTWNYCMWRATYPLLQSMLHVAG